MFSRSLRDFSRSRPARRLRFRPVLETLEERLAPSGNLAVTNALVVDGNDQPLTTVNVGSWVYIQADFTSQDLPSGASYRVAYTVNGVTLDTGSLTWGAGTSGTSSWYAYWGTFLATPGINNVIVTVDPDQSVAETSYADNALSFTFDAVAPAVGGMTYTPAQVRAAYGINNIPSFGGTVPDGSGQTIALVELGNDPTIVADLDGFDRSMSLTTTSTQTLYQLYGPASSILSAYNQYGANITPYIGTSGTNGVPPADANQSEVMMDVEWAHALAPGAKIDLVEVDPSSNWLIGDQVGAGLPGVSAISNSWGMLEWSGESANDSSIFVTPNGHTGVTFLTASNDNGANVYWSTTPTDGYYPATSPNVLSVGGTELTLKDEGYGGETGWSYPAPASTITVGSSSYSQTGSWSSQAGGFSGTYRTAAGGSAGSATWTVPINSADTGWGTELSATWVAGAGNATNATYQVYDGAGTSGTLLGTVTVDQSQAPDGTADGGFQFQELGVFFPTLDGNGNGTLTVVLNAASANGTVVADAVGAAQAWASTGGPTPFESEPSYQLPFQNTGYRTTPDVSFDASGNSGVTCYHNGLWFDAGGTSLGSPCWAALIAIANQGRDAYGGTTFNSPSDPAQILQVLYSLPASDYFDITTGYNGFHAGPGYDLVTGRGSPVANTLIPDLAMYGLSSLSGTAVGTYGGTASLTATVVLNGTPLANEPVTFTLDGTSVGSATTNANGVATLSVGLGTLNVGTHSGAVGASFDGSSTAIDLSVAPAPLTVTVADRSMVYGSALPTLTGTLSGVVPGDSITASYATPATSASDVVAGGYPITATLNDPNGRLSNYTVTNTPGTLTIVPATPTIVWSNPADINVGTPLGSTQLDATVTVVGPAAAGAVTYTPAAGTVLSPGRNQTLSISVAATTDYYAVTASVSINVLPYLAITAPAQAIPGGHFTVTVLAQTGPGQAPASSVVLGLTAAPAGGKLAGTLIAPVINGLATFPNLSTNVAGNYTLFAASDSDVVGFTAALTVVPAPRFQVSLAPAATPGQYTATVTALDPHGLPDTSYAGTVHFTSSDPLAGLPADTVLPLGRSRAFTVTLTTPGHQTVSVADASLPSVRGTSNPVTIAPLLTTATHLGVVTSAGSAPQTGAPVSFNVTPLDVLNNPAGFQDVLVFHSSDARAVLPPVTRFAAGANGAMTFTVVFKTPGRQTVTVTDLTRPAITGKTAIPVGLPATPDHYTVTGLPSPDVSGVSHLLTVTAVDAYGNRLTGYRGVVQLTSSDPSFTAVTVTLTGGVGQAPVALNAVGTQSLTATDTNAATGTEANVHVVPATTHLSLANVVPGTTTVTGGQQITIAVTARTSTNTPDGHFTDLLHFSSSDPNAVLPPDQPFSSTSGVDTFLVTLNTKGAQTVSVTDLSRPGIVGARLSFTVLPANPHATLTVSLVGPSEGVPGEPVPFTVTVNESGLPAGTMLLYHIVWGDGSTTNVYGPSGATVSHLYATTRAQAYPVAVTATDPSGNVSAAATQGVLIVPAFVGLDPADDAQALFVGAAPGQAVVLSSAAPGGQSVTVRINGQVDPAGPFSGMSHILVYGRGGNSLQVAGGPFGPVSIPAILFGGTGSNTLSVSGSSANNVLVGGPGNNVLTGGGGRDILIGGGGAATLHAGSGDDILIGGSTRYDANVAALLAILAEWGRTDKPYEARVQDLFGDGSGGLNGSYLLDTATVVRHAAVSQLLGATASDWFWLSAGTRTTDQLHNDANGEVATFE